MPSEDEQEMWQDLLSFHGQEEDEVVEAVVKPHPWPMIWSAIEGLFLLIIPYIAYRLSGFSAPMAYAFLIILPIIIGSLGYHWFIRNNTVALLTDRRLIAVTQKNLLVRSVAETNLDRIQTAHFEQSGLLATLLNIGTLSVETSDGSKSLILHNIGHPYEVQQAILKTQRQESGLAKDDHQTNEVSAKKSAERPVLR